METALTAISARVQALDDELKGPLQLVEMSQARAERLALQEAAIAAVSSLLPALEPVEQVRLPTRPQLDLWMLAGS